MHYLQGRTGASIWQRLMLVFALLFASTSVMVLGSWSPAFAGHFIAVEAKVDVVIDNNVPYAELRLDHVWTSSGSFSATLNNPSGNSTGISGSTVSSGTGTTAFQVLRFNLSTLSTAGLYTISGGTCCRVDSINVTSSASMSFEAGFWYDPTNRNAWLGSPRFTASVITNVRGGDTFTQNLGGESPNGNSVSYSFIENSNSTTNSLNGAPITTAALLQNYQNARNWTSTINSNLASISNGSLTIPSNVTSAIAGAAYKRLAVKIRLEERDSNNVLRGFVTRDIGFTFANSANVAPSITGVTAGQLISLQPGQTQAVTVTASDTAGQSLTVNANNLPAWATITAQSGTNPASRTITFSPPLGTSASSRSIEVTARDNDGTFPLTTSRSFTVEVVVPPNVVAGDQSINVSWTAPDVDVGQTITNYTVRYSSDGGTNWIEDTPNPASTATSRTITGLTNGATYIVQFATWVDGVRGSWSASSNTVLPGLPFATTPPSISGTPTIGSTLTVNDPDGNWTNPRAEVMTSSYRWQANGTDIPGATTDTFVVTSAYVNAAITVVAERTNTAGTGSSTSSSVTVPNSLLTSLGVSVGSLSPAFSSDIFTYTVSVPYGTASVDLTPAFPGGASTVNGTATASGVARTINTPIGQTPIQVVVNNGGSVTYTVTFDRALPAPDISYSVSSITLAVNTVIGSLTATNAGGASGNWTVSPALPTGLVLDGTNGTISGTPTQATASTVHTVTATNATSSDTFDITILVVEAPTFSYSSSLVTIQDNVLMTPLVPAVTGSPVDSWAISPALPSGLVFDTTSGSISGTPGAAAAGVQYTISATNISGTTQFSLTIVIGTAPSITYGSSSLTLISGTSAVNLSPVNTGGAVTGWSISPALPNGLSFDTTTGALTGTPTASMAAVSYTITAAGVVGNGTFTLTIEVGDAPIVSYGAASLALIAGSSVVNLTPVNTGGPVANWSVSPALPTGLVLDPSTGVLSGTPTTSNAGAIYTITATGVVGASTFNISVSVSPLIIFFPPSTTTPPSNDNDSGDDVDDGAVGDEPAAPPVRVDGGELPTITPGRWQIVQNGQEIEAIIELRDAETWVIRGEGFEMEVGISGDVTGAQLNGVVTLFADREIKLAGGGYRPGTFVDIWMFSTPTFLGTMKVAPNGTFEGRLKVPYELEDGLHTLQANGISDDAQLRSINLGVRLINQVDRQFELPVTGRDSDSVLLVAWWVFLMGVLASGGMHITSRRRTI